MCVPPACKETVLNVPFGSLVINRFVKLESCNR